MPLFIPSKGRFFIQGADSEVDIANAILISDQHHRALYAELAKGGLELGVGKNGMPIVKAIKHEQPAIPLEKHEREVRHRRDQLLRECDWVVIVASERGVSVPPEWVAYRQELRDITAQEGFPVSVTWPTPPTTSPI